MNFQKALWVQRPSVEMLELQPAMPGALWTNWDLVHRQMGGAKSHHLSRLNKPNPLSAGLSQLGQPRTGAVPFISMDSS